MLLRTKHRSGWRKDRVSSDQAMRTLMEDPDEWAEGKSCLARLARQAETMLGCLRCREQPTKPRKNQISPELVVPYRTMGGTHS